MPATVPSRKVPGGAGRGVGGLDGGSPRRLTPRGYLLTSAP
jgi:hypothetical protein